MCGNRFLLASALPLLLAASACGGASRPPELDASTVITLQRHQCFGLCPVYSVSVRGDGSVVFSGESYVRVVGEATAEVPIAAVQELVDAMLDADFFDLDTVCADDETVYTIEDASSATISLTLGRRTKQLDANHGSSCTPRVLRTIEDQIDEVAGTSRWVRCEPANPCVGPYDLPAGSAGG